MNEARRQVHITRVLTQDEFNQFAALSGDCNPIHVDEIFSASTRFGRTVAHGLLLSSILRGLLDRLVPGARLESQTLRFPAPTFAGEPMQFNAAIQSDDGKAVKVIFSAVRVQDNMVTCEGTTNMRRRDH